MTALLIGYGNPGRGDDGLGPAFAQRIAARALPGLAVDVDYQLTAEHALEMSKHQLVIFADAEIGKNSAYDFREILQVEPQGMGSHSVTPEAALALAQTLFHASPSAFVLGISGEKFGEIEEGLSAAAERNLAAAEAFFLRWYAETAAGKIAI